MSVKLHCSLIQNVFTSFLYASGDRNRGRRSADVWCALGRRTCGARRMKTTKTRKENEKTNEEKKKNDRIAYIVIKYCLVILLICTIVKFFLWGAVRKRSSESNI